MLSGVLEKSEAELQLAKMRHNLVIMDPSRGAKRNIDEPPKGPRWVRYQDAQEPLHWAASIGDFVAVKEMICGLEGSKMFCVNDRDANGRTPLMKACASRAKECVEVLIKDYYQTPRPDPIDLNIVDNLGWNALFYAAGDLLHNANPPTNKMLAIRLAHSA